MELITTDELVDQVADKVLERLAESPEKTDEGTPAEKMPTWYEMVLAAYESGGSGYPSGKFWADSPFDGDGMFHTPEATPDEQEAAASKADDFADVMRNGLGAIVAWFNEDAGNTEPEEVERYSLNLELVILDDGNGEAAVYNEGKYLGDVDLTPDDIAALFNRG